MSSLVSTHILTLNIVNRRELVHMFRQRTLILLKALMLQKKVCLLTSSSPPHPFLPPFLPSPPTPHSLTPHPPQIMFYGHPVEKLCTYQYSLITLVPNLLQNLDDCGSPPLATRAQALERPTELKTSDPRSMMRFVGLPLDLFGKVCVVFVWGWIWSAHCSFVHLNRAYTRSLALSTPLLLHTTPTNRIHPSTSHRTHSSNPTSPSNNSTC